MMTWTSHLIITPILLPLVAGAVLLMVDERRRKLKRGLSIGAALLLLVNALALLYLVTVPDAAGQPRQLAYLLGNWRAPFGIVLVADRLTVLFLLLTSILGLTSLLYSAARWDRAGPRFHALFLLLLMGVNGAFLTGDLFNLFVFFEVMLAASYGLALHGSGVARTKAGLHYVTINVATSLLFLIGVSLIYATTGTLNMADLASRIPAVPPDDLMLFEAGAAILGIAFLVKAGMWPLNFWLPPTYAAAPAPVAAVFSILTKVGIYIIIRLTSLLFGDEAGRVAHFTDTWLVIGGIATIIYGTIGVLSARTLARLAGQYVLISSGTLLGAIGIGNPVVLTAALFYLTSSTLAVGAFYLIIEPIERRGDDDGASVPGEPVFDDEYTGALDAGEEDEIGVVIPATIAILGGGFAFCTLLLSGLPPLSGFIGKFAILEGLMRFGGDIDTTTWVFIAVIILSGLAVLITMTRAGIDLIWTPTEAPQHDLRILEAVPIGTLLTICLALMIYAGTAMHFMEDTVRGLDDRQFYIDSVSTAPRRVAP